MSAMSEIVQPCCICLHAAPASLPLSTPDNASLTAAAKLRLCVPDIEWNDDFVICPRCRPQLDLFHQFRQRCLHAALQRKPPAVETFTCNDFNLVFATTTELQADLHRDDGVKTVKQHQCTLCPKNFTCSSNLLRHLKYHRGERPHVCIYCGKSFITLTDLKIHEKLHLNRREYECEQCPKKFNTHKDLRTHRLVVHTDPSKWRFVCHLCSKRFPIKSNFDAHLRRHRDDRPFHCHLCEKAFIDKCGLQKHLRTHSNVRLFNCDLCWREYKEKRALEVHRARCHGHGVGAACKVPKKERKHECHMCPKSYFEKNKLAAHVRRHGGEKPYSCQICLKMFAEKGYVTQHLKKVHGFVGDIVK